MRFLLAAMIVGVASAGCVTINLGAGGGASCPLMTTQQTCLQVAALGCSWSGTACVAQSVDCSGFTTAAACNAQGPTICSWNDPNVCDQADILSCVGANSAYMQCLTGGLQLPTLTAAYANLSIAVDLSAHIQANVDRVICQCMSLYMNCFYDGDCGRDIAFSTIWQTQCTTAFNSMITARPGLAACSASWCSIGRTKGVSTFTVTFTFNAANLPSTWSDSKKAAFVAVLNAELAGSDADWITFDATTGKATLTIPSGTTISAEQLNSIKASFLSWNNPSSSNAAPMFGAMGVEGAQATAEPAPVEQRVTAASSGARAGASLVLAAFASAMALAF